MSNNTPSKLSDPVGNMTPYTHENDPSGNSNHFTPMSSNSRVNSPLTPASRGGNLSAEMVASDDRGDSPSTPLYRGKKTISSAENVTGNVSGGNSHITLGGKHLLSEKDSNDSSGINEDMLKYRRLSFTTKTRIIQTHGISLPSDKTSPVDMNSNKSGLGEALLSDVCINSPEFKSKARLSINLKEITQGTSASPSSHKPVFSGDLPTTITAALKSHLFDSTNVLASFQALTSRTPKPLATTLDKTTFCPKLELDNKYFARIAEDKIDNVMEKVQNDVLMVRDMSRHGLVHWNGKGLKWTNFGEVENDDEDKDRDVGGISGSDGGSYYGIGRRTRTSAWRMTTETSHFYTEKSPSDVYDYDGDNDLTHAKNYNNIDTDDEFESEKPSKKGKKNPTGTVKTNEVELEEPVRKGKGKGKKKPTDKKNDLFDLVRDGTGDWLGKTNTKTNTGKSNKGRGGGKKGRGRKNGGVKKDETKAPMVDTIENYFEKDSNIEGAVGNYSSDENSARIISEGQSAKDVQTSGNMSPIEAICNRVWAKDKPSSSRDNKPSSSRDNKPSYFRDDEVEEKGTCPMCGREMEMSVLGRHASHCQG